MEDILSRILNSYSTSDVAADIQEYALFKVCSPISCFTDNRNCAILSRDFAMSMHFLFHNEFQYIYIIFTVSVWFWQNVVEMTVSTLKSLQESKGALINQVRHFILITS